MKLRWVINFIVITILCVVAVLSLAHRDSAVAAEVSTDKIEGLLLDQLATDGSADYIIRFSEQADLSPAYSMDWDTRGVFVYNTLQDTADRTQKNAKAILDAKDLKYQTFIAANDLYVWGGNLVAVNELATVNELAALPEVESIRTPRTYSIDPLEITTPFQSIAWAGDYLANNKLTTVSDTINATIDWGITDTKADQFWTTFGVKGAGIKVANIDTGVQWNHPGLINQFACPGDPTNPACWSDPSNTCGSVGACDNNGHGTHTMGTIVSADDPGLTYIAGMAPEATWIACKGCKSNLCSDVDLAACADWILAPGGDSANRPNVVNNSWGSPTDGNDWYLSYVNSWRAAGIFPAFSAGNTGPTCNSLGDPGSYQESFAIAAHDSSRSIGSFSSRGDSAFGHIPYTKPNISAPGVAICSTVPSGVWGCISGTSMASPHVAGAVALLWSCNPALVGQIDATFQLLQNNADFAPAGNCGAPTGQPGNFTYGYGYLNVLAAGATTCSGFGKGTLEGYVLDQNSHPVAGASVTAQIALQGNGINTITDSDGFYTMSLVAGTYDLTAAKANYSSQTVNDVLITATQTTVRDFELTYMGAWTQITLPVNCPDWTRYDGEYYPGDGFVYFLGGRGGTNGSVTYGDVIKFDPSTRTCTDTGVDMPNPVSNYTVNLVNNNFTDLLCTFGGRQSNGSQTLNVQCYNPVSHTVSVVGDLPTAYTGYTPGAQVVVDNQVYIFGGFSNLAPPYNLARTDRYNPVTNLYQQLGDLSLARSYIDAAVVDGKIYAFGGAVYDGANLVAQTRAEVMADPGGAGTWDDASVANLPIATAEGRAFGFDTGSPYALAGKIVLAGGGQWPGDTGEAFSYNTATDSYNTSFPNLNMSRRDQAEFIVPTNPGTMWVFGGRSGSDIPPFAPPEYFLIRPLEIYIPLTYK